MVKPKKLVEDVVADATGTATAVAAEVAEERRAKDAERKRKARAAEREQARAAPRKRYPDPAQFNDHPMAVALNTFADKVAGIQGTNAAQSCGLGQAWMAVADHYMGDVASHPLSVAVIATGQFGALAWALRAQQGGAKGPGSPAGGNPAPTPATSMDAPCLHCDKVFPDVPLLLAHVADEHKDVAA